MNEGQGQPRGGLICGFAAYGWWGIMPLYFVTVSSVRPVEVLAHRIVWSLLLLAVVLTVVGRWGDLGRCLRKPRLVALLLTSALLVGGNWFVYIHGALTHQVVQASLGYFINPLFNVLLGLVVFGERLRPWQWAALALAALGLAHQVFILGELPWIALTLAVSFGFYGLVRKLVPTDALMGLTVETLLLAPVAAAALFYWGQDGTACFGSQDAGLAGLLMLSGVMTTIPLLCFGQAAQRLRMSTLGFLQYLSPTIQLLLAVFLLDEPFRPEQRIGFAFTWAALLLLTVESMLNRQRREAAEASAEGPSAAEPEAAAECAV